MTDVNDVIGDLFPGPRQAPRAGRQIERIGEGTYHLDYHDSDHVYLLTLRQIPRVQLPFPRPYVVGDVDGAQVVLVQVSVANHIEVMFDAQGGPARQAVLADYRDRFEQWAARPDQRNVSPPDFPGERISVLRPQVSDDLGTTYRAVSGQAGGSGTEWEATWRYLPIPPSDARLLRLRFSPPGARPVELDLPLPSSQP
jgi:hypothetical protein